VTSHGDRRRRRRAVGPPGAPAGAEPRLGLHADDDRNAPPRPDDAERYRREQPPHHDKGV
jgi:hypothetical protein